MSVATSSSGTLFSKETLSLPLLDEIEIDLNDLSPSPLPTQQFRNHSDILSPTTIYKFFSTDKNSDKQQVNDYEEQEECFSPLTLEHVSSMDPFVPRDYVRDDLLTGGYPLNKIDSDIENEIELNENKQFGEIQNEVEFCSNLETLPLDYNHLYLSNQSSNSSGRPLKQSIDLICKFVAEQTPRGGLNKVVNFDVYNFSLQQCPDDMLKHAQQLLNKALIHTARKDAYGEAINELQECIGVIFEIYRIESSLIRNDQQSMAIAIHMQAALNLADLFRMANHLREALEIYEQAMTIYDADPKGFRKSKINLKAWILRGMADVSIKQKDFSSALRLLQDGLKIAQESKDNTTEYYILCSKARALLDAKQLDAAINEFERAITKSCIIHNHTKKYCLIDADLYSNAGICYTQKAFTCVRIFYNNNIQCVENTKESLRLFGKAIDMHKRAIEIAEEVVGNCDGITYGFYLYYLGEVKANIGDVNGAFKILKTVKKIVSDLDEITKKLYGHIISNTDKMLKSIHGLSQMQMCSLDV